MDCSKMTPLEKLIMYMEAEERVYLVAGPACGKSARITQAAAACGRKVIISNAGLDERIDWKGCVVPDMAAGLTRELPLVLLDYLEKTEEKVLLFLDDLPQGEPSVQSAIKSLMTEGGKLRKNPNVLIWGAGNRVTDGAGAHKLNAALTSEFHRTFAIACPQTRDSPDGAVLLSTWQQERDGWCDWAMSLNRPEIAPIVAYHLTFGLTDKQTLYQFQANADPGVRRGDYRSWESVIRGWCKGLRDDDSVASSIGKSAGSHFLGYLSLSEGLPSLDEVVADPESCKVPDTAAGNYFVAVTIASQANGANISPIIKYMVRLKTTYTALMGRYIADRSKKEAAAEAAKQGRKLKDGEHGKLAIQLSANPDWRKFFLANQAMFSL